MYMAFDRFQHTSRQHQSSSDATGSAFTTRNTPHATRPNTESKDYREQADGAP